MLVLVFERKDLKRSVRLLYYFSVLILVVGVVKELPGEVLLQCHHLPPTLLRLRPLPSLHAQMLFVLQLGIIIMDQCWWRSCRGKE